MRGLLLLVVCSLPTLLIAQDPFHIRVHEYEPLPPGALTLELHANYVAQGTTAATDSVAPTEHQVHLAYEITAGITPDFSIGVMPLSGRRHGQGFDFAGWKILPHFYAPKSWHLPVDAGVVAEFSLMDSAYDKDPARIEIHPVLEKRAGTFIFDANPSFGSSLKSGGQDGWIFAPSLRVRYAKSNRVAPFLEYYQESSRYHHVLGGADIHFRPNLSLSLAVGAGPTPAGNRLVFASRIEYRFSKINN